MRQPIIPYNPQLKQRARELRRKMTLAEILLWKRLKGKQLCGYDFDHQRPVGRRIVDFYCKELKLAVDVDGSVHDFRRAQDERRRGEIEALGGTPLCRPQDNSARDVGLRAKRRVMLSKYQGKNSIYSRRPNLARTEESY